MALAESLCGDAFEIGDAAPVRAVPSLSIVLPCWNEAASIEAVVRAAVAAGASVTSDLEVLAVDDGSTDGTEATLHRLAEELPTLRVVRHAHNLGYGAALRAGFRASRGAYIFFTDTDGQFDLSELARLVEALPRYDLVVGYREARRDGLVRAIYGRTWTVVTDLTLGVGVRDVNCAFKLFPRALVADEVLGSRGALVGAELLSEARARGMRVGEVGVTHYPRRDGQPTGARVAVIARALVELSQLVRRRRAR